MILLLVTSKTMDLESPVPRGWEGQTTPRFQEEADSLVRKLRKLSVEELGQLMGISARLAAETRERLRAFAFKARPEAAGQRPAGLAFTGDVYQSLDATSLQVPAIRYLEKHLKILSGLYGMLSPLDAIQAYRLEPAYPLDPPGKAGSLNEFWKARLTRALGEALMDLPLKQRCVVNLASQEFTRMLDLDELDVPVITPQFKEITNGKLRTVALYAKKARGLMTRFAAENRITDAKRLRAFTESGYSFDDAASTEKEWVFAR